jgi:hypothetical protein
MKDKDDILLTQLTLMFQTAALQQMGKLKNPMTDTIERDLSQAQISIDMLEMLHKKMKGNLTAEEERMLSVVLQELKLNYVDEVSKSQSASPAAAGTDVKQQ